jgi:hypothetical protein
MALDPITAGFELGGKLIDRFLPNKQEADMAKLELAKMAMDGELNKMLEASKLTLAQLDQETRIAEGQIEINKIEAASDHWFHNGWRPAFAWTCILAFFWNLFLGPFVHFVLSTFGISCNLYEANLEILLPPLFGLLGLGAYRTYERINGAIPKGK